MNSSVIFQSESQPVAAALFSNLSLLNHSCKPNIRIEHDGVYVKVWVSHLVTWPDLDVYVDTLNKVFARCHINQDEEIFNSYIDTEMPSDMRQELLQGQYEFICDCQKCLQKI